MGESNGTSRPAGAGAVRDGAESRPAALVVFVEDPAIHDRCRNALGQLGEAGELASPPTRYLNRILYARSEADATGKLDAQLGGGGFPAAILISDRLANRVECALDAQPDATQWATAIRDRFSDRLLGMVAITDWAPKRVPDIDRVVGTNVAPAALQEALQLTAQALSFKSPPEQHRLIPYPVKVRRVWLETELLECFKLRHRVYKLMGYLDDELEADEFGMEVDWYDLRSVQIAAFEETEFAPRAVGTARLILAEGSGGELGTRIQLLARQSPVLRKRFRRPPPMLPLPVWGSQRVESKIACMYRRKESHGELSRVIVEESHRGMGLSRVLVQYALLVAEELHVDWLFLECVPVHHALYRRFGFRKLPGTHERVVNVDKTVIAMECQPAQVTDPVGGLLPDSVRRVFLEQDHLCCCQHRDCYLGEHARYGETCPLRHPLRRPR
jgi:GNAT superfamily N-acetyltransferase